MQLYKMKKIILFILSVLIFFVSGTAPVFAHCPLCTGAVGVAAVSAKYFGLDSSIIGILIGAFGVSTGFWVGRAIKKQFIVYQLHLIVILSFLLTVIPLRFIGDENVYLPLLLAGEPGSFLNKVYWIDKIIFGGIIGGLVTIFAFWLHNHIKKSYGKVLFPFQGAVLTLALLLITSLTLYFIISA